MATGISGVRGREGGLRGDRVITHRPIAVLRAAIMVRAETCNHAALEHLRREETLWFRPFARARSYTGQNFCSRKNRSTDAGRGSMYVRNRILRGVVDEPPLIANDSSQEQ